MLARGEDKFSERNHPILAYSLADHCKGLRPDLTIRRDVIWLVQVQLINLIRRNALIDLDDARTVQRDRVELIRFELNIFVLSRLVAFDNIVGINVALGLGILGKWMFRMTPARLSLP